MKKNSLLVVVIAALTLLMMPFTSFADNTAEGYEHAKQGAHHKTEEGKESVNQIRNTVVWTSYPRLKVAVGGENRLVRDVELSPKNIEPSSIDAYSSNLKAADAHRKLSFDLITAKFGKSTTGGFFWLSAREEQPDKVIVASTIYHKSDRGAKNPTAMFMQQKNALEIIPQPFPREHSRYRANEDWKFLVRYNSKPLVNQKVNMVTQNGSKSEFYTDSQGVVVVHIPDDFKVAKPQQQQGMHSHGRKSSEFVLATEHADAGKTYLTGFNSGYGPDAYDQRSLLAGLSFMALGMLGATPLLRNRKKAKMATTKLEKDA